MIPIGPRSRQWLAEIGLHSLDELKKAGSIPTYQLLKELYPREVSLNLLWGLEAALRGIDWRELTESDKQQLKLQLR